MKTQTTERNNGRGIYIPDATLAGVPQYDAIFLSLRFEMIDLFTDNFGEFVKFFMILFFMS